MKDNTRFFEQEGMKSAGEATSLEVRQGYYNAEFKQPDMDFMEMHKEHMEFNDIGFVSREDLLSSNQSHSRGFPHDR